jgi:hypothetical protein
MCEAGGAHNLPGRHNANGVGGSADMALFMANTNKHFADPAVLHADLDLLLDIVVLLCAAALGGMLATVVRMPPIIGYILGGVAVGPSGCALIGAVVQVSCFVVVSGVVVVIDVVVVVGGGVGGCGGGF